MTEHNKACLCLPTAVPKDYAPKGKYDKVLDMDTCTLILSNSNTQANCVDFTGPTTASRAVLLAYDAFGYSPQLLQGADMLSAALNALIIVPDFFNGKPAQAAWFPPDTDEKKAVSRSLQFRSVGY